MTVSHMSSKEEVMRQVDRSFDDLFRGLGTIPIQLIEERRTWQGSLLSFAISAKMGILKTPITGTIDVSERDITIDVDLGLLERLIPQSKVRESLSGAVRGLIRSS